MNNPLQKIDYACWIFFGGAIFILWQMLLPGYVLNLDMIFTPSLKVMIGEGAFINSLPLQLLLHSMNWLLPGWLIQKFILVTLFFCLGYLPYKYLELPDRHQLKYWGGLFYVINPFVYERFLAGHWMHLFAYSFMPLIIYYLKKTFNNFSARYFYLLVIFIWLTGIFSLQFLAIDLIIILFFLSFKMFCLIAEKKIKELKFNFMSVFFLIVALVLLNSFWLLPYLDNQSASVINSFSVEHWQAFKTATDQRVGLLINVLGLYGFWGEHEPWSENFLWAKSNFNFWLFSLSLVLIVVLTGMIRSFRQKKKDFWLIAAMFAGFVFSCGLADSLFILINSWLFNEVPFWSGFRDTNKFSAILALGYAYFGALGVGFILEMAGKKIKNLKFISTLLFLIPLFLAYPMLGGFSGQIKSVWFPPSWQHANDFLDRDKENFKILFLPWHGYMTFEFADNLLIANPAKYFFNKPVIQSENIELAQAKSLGEKTKKLDELISNQAASDKIMKELATANIKYIIVSENLEGWDSYDYRFLEESNLLKRYEEAELTIYELVLK